VRDGGVIFHFAARPEVCGDGERVIRIGRSYIESNSSEERQPCVRGPVQVRLTVREGAVERVETWVGPMRSREGHALGMVPAREAARYLVELAARADGRVSARAITPAVLADSAVVWPELLAIARAPASQRRAGRGDATFWLARFASAAISGHPGSLATDDDEEKDEVKVHAVFVLSQLANREGIPALIDIARSNADLAVRRSALFWLGQSGDPRALALFESLLRG